MAELSHYVASGTDAEVALCGITHDTLGWGDMLRPLMIKQGVPDHKLRLGAPCDRTRDDDLGITTFYFPR